MQNAIHPVHKDVRHTNRKREWAKEIFPFPPFSAAATAAVMNAMHLFKNSIICSPKHFQTFGKNRFKASDRKTARERESERKKRLVIKSFKQNK